MRRLLTTTLIMASVLAGPAIPAAAALGPAVGGAVGVVVGTASSPRGATDVQEFAFVSYEADYYLSRAEDRT
ncbi:MAG: hypothetical protein LH605_04895, partial [Microbacteriaceae bacterium]|nr:hypothetical protein [Microbacteriaceae bacterium]